jgi:transposase
MPLTSIPTWWNGLNGIRASIFIPTSSSWLNLVERFFAEIKRIRRGVFKSVLDREVAIYRYLAEHNERPKPFVWTATAGKILEKVENARASLDATIGIKR